MLSTIFYCSGHISLGMVAFVLDSFFMARCGGKLRSLMGFGWNGSFGWSIILFRMKGVFSSCDRVSYICSVEYHIV
jgi:hypothetical protein